MTRRSDYTTQEIITRAALKGFDHLSGEHSSGDSEHSLRCRSCGGIQTKRSRQIVSPDKGACIYLPCHPRGKPLLLFLARQAGEHGVSLVDERMPEATIVGACELLRWESEGKVMTQSWRTIFRRLSKGGRFFIADSKTERRPRQPKRSNVISTLEEAKEFIASRNIENWGIAVNRYPAFSGHVIRLGLKNDLFRCFGWEHKAEYVSKSDAELIELAANILRAKSLNSINDLERLESGLARILRRRGLVGRLCDYAGIGLKDEWRGMSFDTILKFVRDARFVSLTEWHGSSSGSYKHASERGWLVEIAASMGWGDLRDSKGITWRSYPEVIVANLLHSMDIEFEPNKRIENFRGRRDGACSCDMYVSSVDLWVEVWAYFDRNDAAGQLLTEDYTDSRNFKEHKYAAHGLRLCSIEGRLLYRPRTLDGVEYKAGIASLKAHARRRLEHACCGEAVDGEGRFH